ncbi:MAG: hypothetical protein J6A83_04195 [Clostridia bacterium]|nr:hypothetical protein [Clostridia bacterium]
MKRALSLILALVMVALMIPFSAFVTSATDGETGDTGETKTVTSPVELDEAKYSTLYSVDFSKVTNADELDAAGWYITAGSGYTVASNALTYSEEGLYYRPAKGVDLTCGGESFNTADSFVVDFSFKLNQNPRYLYLRFDKTNPQEYLGHGGNGSAWTLRGNSSFDWDGSSFYENDTYSTSLGTKSLSAVSADAAAAVTGGDADDRADVRLRLFIVGGKSQYAVMDITGADGTDYGQFYLMDSVANTVADGGYFFIGVNDNASATRQMLLKSFTVHKYNDVPAVEYDEDEYASPLYSVNFGEIADADALDTAGWKLTANSGTTAGANTFSYSADGLLYHPQKNVNFICGGFSFNATDNFVIDYTFKMAPSPRTVHMHFNTTDPSAFTGSTSNSDRWLFRGNDGEMAWDASSFRNSTYTSESKGDNLKSVDSEAATAVMTDKVDVRIRIFVIAGESQYAVMDIDGAGRYYIKDNVANAVADGSYFAFSSGDGQTVGTRGLLLKNFSIYKYDTPDAVPVSDKACVTTTEGAGWYIYDGLTVDATDYTSDILCVKEGDAYSANTVLTVEAGKTYEIISHSGIAAGDAELRLASNPGIRYKTLFNDKADYDFIMANINPEAIVDVKMGTLITLKEYADALTEAEKELTAENLAAYGEEQGKKVYMDVTADAANLYAENTFAGSVVGVKAYDRSYVARAYITLTFGDATTVTLYTDASAATSVAELAKAIVDGGYAGYDDATQQAALDYLATFVAAAE